MKELGNKKEMRGLGSGSGRGEVTILLINEVIKVRWGF